MFLAILAFALIGVTASRALQTGRSLLFDDMDHRVVTLAKRAGTAMYPRPDPFFLHTAVSIVTADKLIKYAVILDADGRIRSHSVPDLIGELDETPEGAAAMKFPRKLRQDFTGPDGLRHHYFSSPIIVGSRRVGTAALALDPASIEARLAPLKHRLVVILAAMFSVIALLLVIRQLLRKVERAAELKSAMMHAVSHEFNNALSSLEGGVFLLKESEPPGSPDSRAPIYRMLTDVQGALRTFVRNILNEARMEAGKFKPELRPVVLKEMAEKCVAGLEELIRHKRISLYVERKEPVPVKGDPDLLSLVISNLVGNALKYTPEGGNIRISIVQPGPGLVRFSVCNDGAGISAEDIRKLKDGFYRTADGKAKASGFGLGMKIVNDMLAMHGSGLEIESEFGRSSTFSFTLPVPAEAAGGNCGPLPAVMEYIKRKAGFLKNRPG